MFGITFLSAPAVLQACRSSGLNLDESAASAWTNCRLYSIFTRQVKHSAAKRGGDVEELHLKNTKRSPLA